MSRKIECKIEIRDMKILKDTLTKMGFTTKESESVIHASKEYRNFTFSEGKVSYDDMHHGYLEPVLAEYAKNYQVSQIEKKGRLYSVRETDQEIIIDVKRS